jgi:hypothetical protein
MSARALRGSPATTRLRLLKCSECGCKVRLARVWLLRAYELGRRPSCPVCGVEASCPDVSDAALFDDRARDVLEYSQALSDRNRAMAARRALKPRSCRHEGCARWVAKGELYCKTHESEGMPF